MIRLSATLRPVPAPAIAGATPSYPRAASLCLLALTLAASGLPAHADDAPGTAAPAGAGAQVAPAAGGSTAEPGAPATAGEAASAAEAAATAKGDAEFFAQNAHRPGVVALHGGGQALKLSGAGGDAAAGAQMVVVNLSRRGLHEPAPVQSDTPVGVQNARYRTQNLPRPLFEAVQLMHVGERWEIYTPASAKVTGAKGKPGRMAMPASVFTLELLSAK